MIEIPDGICYSPSPPERYFKRISTGGWLGLPAGEVDLPTLPRWNLYWLACPWFGMPISFQQLERIKPTKRDTEVAVCAHLAYYGEDLVRLLRLPPGVFLQGFRRLRARDLLQYDPPLDMNLIRDRVFMADDVAQAPNVIYLNAWRK